MWAACIVVALGLYILYVQVGLAFIAAVISMVVLVLILQYLGRPVGRLSVVSMALSDTRVNIISNLLHQIKGVKLSAYESLAIDKVNDARAAHLMGKREMWKQLAKTIFVTNTMSNVLSLTTLGYISLLYNGINTTNVASRAYSIMTVLNDSVDLLGTARLFTAYGVMSVIAAPLLQVGQYYSGVINAYRSLKRIEKYLASPEVGQSSSSSSSTLTVGLDSGLKQSPYLDHVMKTEMPSKETDSDTSVKPETAASPSHVVFQHASIGWGEKMVLEDIYAEIPLQKLVMVVGGVAAVSYHTCPVVTMATYSQQYVQRANPPFCQLSYRRRPYFPGIYRTRGRKVLSHIVRRNRGFNPAYPLLKIFASHLSL